MSFSVQDDYKIPKCALCITQVESIKKCEKCNKRIYCSVECETNDWVNHKYWCNKSGEINIDYEMKYSSEKGVGVYALRNFIRGDKIMVERPVMKSAGEAVSKNIYNEVMKLMPLDGNISDKFHLNTISKAGLFLNISRINNSCIGNSEHGFLQKQNIMLLVATRNISIGEEITFSYINYNVNRRFLFKDKWNFICKCPACTNPEINKQLKRMAKLDKIMISPGLSIDDALFNGESLIKIYDDLGASTLAYGRTYYDMFQYAITKKTTQDLAKKYIQLALDNHLLFYGSDIKCDENNKMRYYVDNPTQHPLYLMAEN
jgi:hypothetical protein